MNKYVILLLALLLAACDNSVSTTSAKAADESAQHNAELQALIKQVKNNLVFVEGGDFLMGDFGKEYGPEKLRYDVNEDSKPLHKVRLSSYSISKFKTTNQEYQLYLKLNNLQLRKISGSLARERFNSLNKLPNTPAHADWNEAERYCTWLGQVSGLPFSLPAEAQWEYAARSRGQFFIVGTNSGVLEMNGINRGINISGSSDREDFADKMGLKTGIWTAMPVDSYPPNPLGLYDMAGNGYEWMHDWYDPDYYKNSPAVDPQGPEKPVHKVNIGVDYDIDNPQYAKVLRGAETSDPFEGLTITRFKRRRDTKIFTVTTVRCVVNSPQPVK